jgi:hypothetical protein
MAAPERFAKRQIPLAPRAVAVDTVITVNRILIDLSCFE